MSAEERPLDLVGVRGVIGDQPAADLGAIRPAHQHRVAALESPFDLDDAGRQQALAAAQRLHRAGIDGQHAARLERAGDPFLARGDRIGRRQEPGAGRAVGDRAQADASRGRRRSPYGCRRWWRSCRLRSWCACRRARSRLPAAPAMASISRRDARHHGNVLGARALARRLVVEPVDVGEQHQEIGAHHGGDAGGEPVVVAVADLGGGDGVVLVDHRHRAPFQAAWRWWSGR